MKLAIIPARGGSKRIPRKNIKPFLGVPIIGRSISTALESGCFDQVLVSTDDMEIAEVARSFGAEVPFIRPPELSDDHTGTIPVIRHAIQWVQSLGANPEYACCIYPTAPFLTKDDLRQGEKLLVENKCDYSFSVTRYGFPIQRAIRLTANERVSMFNPEHFNTRSQDLEEAYHDAGQFYWGRVDAWLEGRVIFGPQSAPVILSRARVQDIDTFEDWDRAEWMFRILNEHFPSSEA